MVTAAIVMYVNLILLICFSGGLIYLFVLLVKALRKYLKSEPARKEAATVRKSLGEALKDHRIRCQMTQEFVAESLGVSRQAVSKWETGASDPSTSNLLALAKLYGIDAAELLKEGHPMNTLEAIAARRSYRGKFLPTPIPRAHLKAIVEAGYHAPSGCNKQTTAFIAVDDSEIMAKLHAVIDPPVGETAPSMICVLTRKIIAYRDRTFYIQDYAAAIENILLAITELGYASCWIEGHITDVDRIGDKMAKILGVPDEYELVCFLPVGIPAEECKPVKKQPFDTRAWLNGFGNKF